MTAVITDKNRDDEKSLITANVGSSARAPPPHIQEILNRANTTMAEFSKMVDKKLYMTNGKFNTTALEIEVKKLTDMKQKFLNNFNINQTTIDSTIQNIAKQFQWQ
ncbi:unnamed protein product [Diamesa serratosioi]